MKIMIDQSGRTEYTSKSTVIAYSNGSYGSVIVSGRTKRKLQDMFRQVGEPRTFMLYVFTALIFILLKPIAEKLKVVVIDIEYPGYDKVITLLLSEMFIKNALPVPEISFVLIGKKSNAHMVAINAYRKHHTADQNITFEEIERECFVHTKQNGYPVLKYQVVKTKGSSAPMHPYH